MFNTTLQSRMNIMKFEIVVWIRFPLIIFFFKRNIRIFVKEGPCPMLRQNIAG